ncbi:MAG TPA: ABC transporter permease [Acidobacteriaceae bacterium]|jgi:predicted permease
MAQNLHEFLFRLKALFHKRRLDRDLNDELSFHQEMLRDKLVGQGVPQVDADAKTRRAFGNASRWHERLSELWQFRWLESLRRDVSFSGRVLRKSPGYTGVALLTLALGVGANTTVFSMVNGLLLRPLSVPESDRLAVLGINTGDPRINYTFSEPLFRGLERRHEVFSQVFAFSTRKMQVKGANGIETVPGQLVSGEFFHGLQSAPLLGRTLTGIDDRKGGNPAGFGVVISESFWQRWFNRAPNVIGQKLQIDNTVFTVVGVTPKRFIGADPLERPEVFVPLALEPVLDGSLNLTDAGLHAWWLVVMGRLQQGATLQRADAEVASSFHAIVREVATDPGSIADLEKRHLHLIVESGSAGFTYVRLFFRKPLGAVFAMCVGILLLACMNLASLLMARGAARQAELATRLALGATRRQLVQQLLVESLLIALMGTGVSLAFAPLLSKSLSALLVGGADGIHIDTSLDIRVFAFGAVASIVATFLVGLIPALQATSGGLSEQIKSRQHTTQAHERRRMLPRIMMAGEVALALMLVVGAGLLASSLVRLYRSGAGFNPQGLINISYSLDKLPLKGEPLLQFYRQLGDGLRRQPGVTGVSFARMVPFTHSVWDEDMSVGEGKTHDVYHNSIGPQYFSTMGIPIFAGRDFAWSDTPSTGLKIILNQTAAKALFPDRSPLGQTVVRHGGKTTTQFEVVGVVGDAKYENLRSPAPPAAYVPMTQDDGTQGPSYNAVVRTNGEAAPLADAARSLAMSMQPGIPAPVMTPMPVTIDDSLSAERTMALLAVFFAICALTVTAIGLYGTLAYATSRRTTEIGIRMALGARRAQVVVMVFLQNAGVALAGTTVGLIAALLISRALSSFLYGISPRDPWIFAGSVLALALIASGASLLPALRSARIHPMAAIRCE